jgi:hypothetical protein
VRERANMVYRASWSAAFATTGVVAGFMLGHALVLGRFLDWLLAAGHTSLFAQTYPVFARSAGRSGLAVFYAVAGVQVAAALGFLAASLITGRARSAAIVVAFTAVAWPLVHYGSGFGAVEAEVLRSTEPVRAETVNAFLRWNGPVHLVHAALLVTGLIALLSAPPSKS